jgi:hypothetical protein
MASNQFVPWQPAARTTSKTSAIEGRGSAGGTCSGMPRLNSADVDASPSNKWLVKTETEH